MSDLDRRNDDWPLHRRPKHPPAPRIDRKHDPVYREIRAELEARELGRRQRETASKRQDLPAIAAAEPAELAELTTVCTT
jgi:hypothetical protein